MEMITSIRLRDGVNREIKPFSVAIVKMGDTSNDESCFWYADVYVSYDFVFAYFFILEDFDHGFFLVFQ